MAAYLIGAGLIYAMYFLFYRVFWKDNRRDARDYFIVGAFSVLFLVAALRGPGVGIDTSHYMAKFQQIDRYAFFDVLFSGLYCERVEVGYALMNKILGWITSEPYVIVLVNSALVCYGMAFFQWRFFDGDDLMFVILFLCGGTFLQSLNIARQLIAVVLVLNAWGYLTRKRYVTAAVLFLVALTFHIMAIVCLVMAVFYLLRYNRKATGVLAVLSFAVMACYRPIVQFFAQFISVIGYLDDDRNRISAGGIWALWAVELVMAAVFLWMYFRRSRTVCGYTLPEAKQTPVTLFCMPLFVIYYMVLTFIGTRFNYFNRFGEFFLPFTMLLFSDFGTLLASGSRRLHRLYTVGLHVCFLGYLMLSTYTGHLQYIGLF